MLGPDLSCEDADLVCPGPKIIMWEPDYVGCPTCLVGTPRYGDPDLLCGGEIIMLGPLLIMSGPQILCDIASI